MDLVLNLYRASLVNQRTQVISATMGFSVAVLNALDTAFCKGKGQILKKWIAAMESLDHKGQGPSRKKPTMTPGALAFFMSLPRRKKE